jgi:hypothetical protein
MNTDRTPTTEAGRALLATFEPGTRTNNSYRAVIRAIEAEARAPLDVERLARAMATESVRRWVMEAWVDSGVSEPGYATPDEMAAAIAREYAALEEPTDD